ncbi:MAG: hypothetical protein ACRC2B_06065, partial [Rubrivivax sp.]
MSRPRVPERDAARGDYPEPDKLRSGALPMVAAQGGAWSHVRPEVWSEVELKTVRDAFGAVFQRGVHGLCFSPYLEGQAPGDHIGEAQIRERLKIIQPTTRWIRTFSCTDGHEQTPRIAHELGMQTLVGAWIGTDAEINEREIQGVIEVARAGHADIVAVGNEVLLREDMGED